MGPIFVTSVAPHVAFSSTCSQCLFSTPTSDNGSDEYMGGYIFLQLVEASTIYEHLVEMLFDRMQRSPMEYKFSMKSVIASYSQGRMKLAVKKIGGGF